MPEEGPVDRDDIADAAKNDGPDHHGVIASVARVLTAMHVG
jgi:hypothetical protein